MHLLKVTFGYFAKLISCNGKRFEVLTVSQLKFLKKNVLEISIS